MPDEVKVKKVPVRFLKPHRHDGIDSEAGDITSVHPKVAELLTRVPGDPKPGQEPEQQIAELVTD